VREGRDVSRAVEAIRGEERENLRRCARAWCHVRGPLAPRARARDVVNLRSSGGVIATHRYPVRRGRYGRTRSVSQRDSSRKRETSAISGIMASPNCDRNREISSPPPQPRYFVIRKQADSFYTIHFSALYSLYERYELVNDNNGSRARDGSAFAALLILDYP